ncbi:hypothetical protein FISHEDRAFT_51354 [Fistulina hepatica ATCC 64428]|uniref:Conserved oligomeric Golgi complex subunit 7 n=1 Tax=Fistulina hepatica ATCC 64428 TaxID=1128425 RepID=A0A0D7A3H1_9AGAR|nr:hypothetical protein FISHEDRAFT_51354 [Fistulina hepatica ATCC 64428]
MTIPSSTAELVESLQDYNDMVAWINDTLSSVSQQSEDTGYSLTQLDQQLTYLVATLDIACEDTSSHLERVIEDVSRGVPRLIYDLHFMRDGCLSLQSNVAQVSHRANSAVPSSTGAALEHLKVLDAMKRHMEAARDVLREAESWSTLELEVTSLLDEHNYGKAAERLSEASRSMDVFQNTSDYEPRKALLVALQNQLEAALSSALVSAIGSQDFSSCRNYFAIFSNIQRESEFRQYYNGSRRASLVAMWQEALISDCNEPQRPGGAEQYKTFVAFLQQYYSSFLALLNEERTSIPAVFPDPPSTMSNLITSTISSLQPSFSQRMASVVQYYGDSALKELILIVKVTEGFATSVAKIFEKLKYSSDKPTQDLAKSPVPPTLHRRRSSRMSISWRSGRRMSVGAGLSAGAAREDLDWDRALFQPFVQLQVDYGSLERRVLDGAVSTLISNDIRPDDDRARLLREQAVDLFGIAEDSMQRCASFTYGYGSVDLIHALDGFLQSFIESWTSDITREHISIPQDDQSSISEGDLADLDYTPDDWSSFGSFLRLLSSARSVSERMTIFEIKLRSHLTQLSGKFRMARQDPEHFPIAPSRGEALLLEQSTLNSAELSALFGAVDPEPSSESNPGLRPPHLASTPAPLLIEARSAIFKLAKACQISLQTIILSPLRMHLATYASSVLWTQSGDPKSARTITSNDLSLPSFSKSPSDIIQRVAEGLLNLPRLFEVYSDDDALSFSLQTLSNLDPETLKELTEQSVAEPQAHPHSHLRRTSVSVVSKSMDPQAVSSAWLASLGHTLLHHFVENILPSITALTPMGAAQLASDLEYISNIVRALNVESEELEKWKRLVNMDDEDGRKEVEQGSAEATLTKVAVMRGWIR